MRATEPTAGADPAAQFGSPGTIVTAAQMEHASLLTRADLEAFGSRRAARRAVRRMTRNGDLVATPPPDDPLIDPYSAEAIHVELSTEPKAAARAALSAGVRAAGRTVIAVVRDPATDPDAITAAIDCGVDTVLVATGDAGADETLAEAARLREQTRFEGAPLISIVICSRNARVFIDECLGALAHLRYPRYEVIFVDDGSTDDSREIARRHDVRLLELPWGGTSTARNAGVEAASGELVMFLDVDAVAQADVLARNWRLMDRVGAGGSGGPNIPFDDAPWQERVVSGAPGVPIPVVALDGTAPHLPSCNLVVRRDAMRALGGFNPVFTAVTEDSDLCARFNVEGHQLWFHPRAIVWHHRRSSIRKFIKQQWIYAKWEPEYETRYGENVIAPPQLSLLGRIDPRRPRPVFTGPQANQLYTVVGHNIHADLPLKLVFLTVATGLVGLIPAALLGFAGWWALGAGLALVALLVVIAARVPAFSGAYRATLTQRLATAGVWLAFPVVRGLGRTLGHRRLRRTLD